MISYIRNKPIIFIIAVLACLLISSSLNTFPTHKYKAVKYFAHLNSEQLILYNNSTLQELISAGCYVEPESVNEANLKLDALETAKNIFEMCDINPPAKVCPIPNVIHLTRIGIFNHNALLISRRKFEFFQLHLYQIYA